MITVLIERFEFSCIIGLLDFERESEQKIVVSAKFRADEYIDYALACKIIENSFKKEKFFKVEDALEYFSDKFKKEFKTLNYFYMKILKPEILDLAVVGAEIQRNY